MAGSRAQPVAGSYAVIWRAIPHRFAFDRIGGNSLAAVAPLLMGRVVAVFFIAPILRVGNASIRTIIIRSGPSSRPTAK